MIADIIAEDAQGRPVLVIEVSGRALGPDAADRVLSYMETSGPPLPFGMVADPKTIRVLRYDCDEPVGFRVVLDTATILGHYDPEFASKQIFANYLGTLVEAWLRDLAFHWKSEMPPGSKELAGIGLLPKIQGGDTRREVRLADPVR